MEQVVEKEMLKDMSWLKGLLNNMPLLKWVKKFSADKLFSDNKYAEKLGVKTNEESISVSDDTLTKVLVTNSRFAGPEYVRFNVKQLAEVITLLGSKGELIITQKKGEELPNMVIQIADTTVLVCPLPEDDRGDSDE